MHARLKSKDLSLYSKENTSDQVTVSSKKYCYRFGKRPTLLLQAAAQARTTPATPQHKPPRGTSWPPHSFFKISLVPLALPESSGQGRRQSVPAPRNSISFSSPSHTTAPSASYTTHSFLPERRRGCPGLAERRGRLRGGRSGKPHFQATESKQ